MASQNIIPSILINNVKEDDGSDYAFLPITEPDLHQFYDEQYAALWVKGDLDLKSDKTDWDNLKDEGIKKLVMGILKFFVFADGMVIGNIFKNFQEDTQMFKSATAFYSIQNFIEVVHSEIYSEMARSFLSKSEYAEVLAAYKESHVVKKIAAFILKYMDRSKPLLDRVAAFACVEGILFTSAFAAIAWIKKKNILRGFCKANEFIARDEGIHTRFAVALFNKLKNLISGEYIVNYDSILEIVEEAVNVNKDFIDDIIPAPMVGMSAESLLQYSKCVTDELLYGLGTAKIYNTVNPFDWMIILSCSNKTNFFEDKVSEYCKLTEGNFEFLLDAYF